MFRLFGESFRLLFSNLLLFSAIILTVWLPGNFLVNYLAYNVFGEENLGALFRITMVIEGIFGPLYIGALVYAVSELKAGRPVTYARAIGVGLRTWGRLFAARVLAGIVIFLGFIALVIPGIVLMVLYSLLDSVVILEGAGARTAMRRSKELTKGIRWQIFGAAVLFFIGFFLFTIGIYLPLAFIEALNLMSVEVILDSIGDVVFGVIQILMVLFYLEARERQSDRDELTELLTPPDPATPPQVGIE